jgi:tetratricopeptide (TPR) repeat protein/predicted Ser/Thr protein kinase
VGKLDETVDDDDHSPSSPPGKPAPPLGRGAALGRYVVLDLLGEGGMGVVYAAYDPELDRKLAVKLLRYDVGSGGVADRRQRLLREAQALARLHHENVVAVYDVGTLDDQVFVAMEFIAGQTVRAWLEAEPREWRAIVEVYRQAGRGLAAAHALGIVHRDFKPENVLIDDAGRVRVVDFGLARTAHDAGDAPSKASSAPDWERRPDGKGRAAMAASLTRTGALVGTPGYIAPEQQTGRTLPAVDQFSLCVALWQGLYRELPFEGDSAVTLAAAAAKGELRPPPRGTKVPSWIHKVLVRGLAPDPDGRFPSMDALLDALADDPVRRRNRLAIGFVVGVPAVIAIWLGTRGGTSGPACAVDDRRLAWTADRKAQVHTALVATKTPFAATTADNVVAALDRYASEWIAARVEACEATRVRGEQSEELLDLRMACLDGRAHELRAFGDVLVKADAKTAEKAVQAAAALPAIDACADAAALMSPVRPPTPEIRATVVAIRGQIADVRALDAAGKYQDAIARGKPLVEAARATHYRPVEAEALVVLGTGQKDAGDLPNAQASLEGSVLAATAARDDATAAQAATLLVRLVGFDRAKHADGEQWAARAEALLEAHHDDRTRSLLDNNLGVLQFAEDHQDQALARHTEALALREKIWGAQSPLVAASLDNIGLVYGAKGDFAKAADYHKRALAIEEAAYGSSHPIVGGTLTNLAVALAGEIKYDEALQVAQRAVALKEAAYGPESAQVAMSLNQIGNLHYYKGEYAQAVEVFRRTLAIKQKTLGAEHPSIASAMHNIANCLERMGKLDEAQALDNTALAMKLKLLSPDHSEVAHSYTSLGQIAIDRSRWSEAADYFRRAVAIWTKSSPGSANLAMAYNGLGESELGAGDFDAAVDNYDKARAIRDVTPVDLTDRVNSRLGLAKALWGKGDRARAKETADSALAIATGEKHDEVAKWIAAHH